jgi:dinuclear metal center YbgI/SA1388 family protein
MPVKLYKLLEVLEETAPLELAEEWDNVGLLLCPSRKKSSRRILLTIDLTEPVLEEALRTGVDTIVAYHPPIFDPLSELTPSRERERVILRLVESRIAVYSPHTALDSVRGGVNDWLAEGLGEGESEAIIPFVEPGAEADASTPGQGRLLTLRKPVKLSTLVRRVKSNLGLKKVRVARGRRGDPVVASVALCAGAGGSVLGGVEADAYVSGEMRHHDVLDAKAQGTSVILCEHTNTERGYLPILRAKLALRLGRGVEVRVSRTDREPLELA